jgi:hypothetical protein
MKKIYRKERSEPKARKGHIPKPNLFGTEIPAQHCCSSKA